MNSRATLNIVARAREPVSKGFVFSYFCYSCLDPNDGSASTLKMLIWKTLNVKSVLYAFWFPPSCMNPYKRENENWVGLPNWTLLVIFTRVFLQKLNVYFFGNYFASKNNSIDILNVLEQILPTPKLSTTSYVKADSASCCNFLNWRLFYFNRLYILLYDSTKWFHHRIESTTPALSISVMALISAQFK